MNKINSLNNLGKILNYIDNNQYPNLFAEFRLAEIDQHGLSSEVIQQLNNLFLHKNKHLGEWNNFLTQLSTKTNTDRIFTTFLADKNDIDKIQSTFVKSGDGIIRNNQSSIELVTISDQLAKISFEEIPDHNSLIIHFWGNLKSNLEDNLYLELKGNTHCEAIRFGNTGFTHTASGTTLLCNTKTDKLYTIVLSKDFLKVYLNGILYLCKSIPIGFKPSMVSLKLIGVLGADLSAAICGMEICTSDMEIENLFSNDQAIFINRIDEYMKNSVLHKIHELLETTDGFDITIAEEQLLQLLSNELNNEQGYREWIFEKLLSRVSKTSIEAWYKKNIVKFPGPILEVKNLMVEFYRTPNTRFSLGRLARLHKNNKFRVLDNININVYPGDIIGIVGANGAGKSTLLKTISGMIPINQGNVNLYARHLLLSAGLGARNELTGRENIYLSGCFMGLNKKQIDDLYEEIVDFSELGEAIDRPFKYYSDGMKGRLVFSIATSVSPDILMLDELLSAGDIKFQQKAAKRMDQLIQRAKVVVVVTHSTQFVVQKCNKALLLSKGKQVYYGDPAKAISLYLNELHMQPTEDQTDLGPNNINMIQQMAQTNGMPIGGQRAN
ncbi:ABC transporter ATP-binding protein [Legionella bononiensis]|uniref:ABC transporter ATP-binding protein n=1 Tax=Legionella bononiensis TaxID=2793102 RepID=A0ABS1W7X0_9GAMM|nr:ATP-binding cassette domain-containing protein [Legionella bononiensis]MBL7480020.1 ABC transporter ATP-binding protein [Legionella bononiensis]MBL7525466.1 ABC transporter ATP-binding protein [Legionella bononiensis]MBL7561649.1 ABC transporter ATP-binding protein [Legionella bononiensis]